jgi:hypothetical protein
MWSKIYRKILVIKMKNIKTRDSFIHLDEMAKAWPVGTIVKSNDIRDTSTKNYRGWDSWRPSQAPGAEGGKFYMRITESGKAWLVGKIIYQNCITAPIPSDEIRFRVTHAESPSAEFRIFERNKEEISKLMNKSFFIEGTEAGIMGNDGEKAKNITENEYTVRSLNFKLSDLYDEPVLCLFAKNNNDKNFSIKMSELESLTKELSSEQREVIGEWFAKKIGAQIELSGENFRIQTYTVYASSTDPFPSSFSAGPFISTKQAQDFLDNLKKEDHTMFSTSELKVNSTSSYSLPSLNLEQLIKFAKGVGIETTMKELLALKRGAVTAKKFGL